MRKTYSALAIFGAALYLVSMALPVSSVPFSDAPLRGWQAFRAAASGVWPYELPTAERDDPLFHKESHGTITFGSVKAMAKAAPGEVHFGDWASSVYQVMSAATNIVVWGVLIRLLYTVARRRSLARHRGLGIATAVSGVINTWWLVGGLLDKDPGVPEIGYFAWWLSFGLLAIALIQPRSTEASTSPEGLLDARTIKTPSNGMRSA